MGFIGAGQAAQSLVRGFAAAGELCIKPGIQVCVVQARRFQSAGEPDVFIAVLPSISRRDRRPQNHSQRP